MNYEKFKNKAKSLDGGITDAIINNFTRHILILFLVISTTLAVVAFICTRQNFMWVIASYVVSILTLKVTLDYALVSKEYFYTVRGTLNKYYLAINILAVLITALVYMFV